MVWEDEVDRNGEVGAVVDAALGGSDKLRRMAGHETVATKAAMAALAEGRSVYGVALVDGKVVSLAVESIVDARAEYGTGGPERFEVVYAGGAARVVLPGATFWVEKHKA
jgi:hypothetical protein